MTVEEKALALLNEVRAEWNRTPLVALDRKVSSAEEALYRAIEREQAAIEAHEADKKAFSDALKFHFELIKGVSLAPERFSPFILPDPEPDPLEEILAESMGYASPVRADRLRTALAACGYKIERIDQ